MMTTKSNRKFSWKFSDREPAPKVYGDIISLPADYQTQDLFRVGRVVYSKGSIMKFLLDLAYCNSLTNESKYERRLYTFSYRPSKGTVFTKIECYNHYDYPGLVPDVYGAWDLSKNPTNQENHHLFFAQPQYVTDNLWVTCFGDVFMKTPSGNWERFSGNINEYIPQSAAELDLYKQVSAIS